MLQIVHLVYCESGIETTAAINTACRKQVHLVYCESGIETCDGRYKRHTVCCSFSLLRERY